MGNYTFTTKDGVTEELAENLMAPYLTGCNYDFSLNDLTSLGTLDTDREIEPGSLEQLQGLPIMEEGPVRD
jgi:hypothetical protein